MAKKLIDTQLKEKLPNYGRNVKKSEITLYKRRKYNFLGKIFKLQTLTYGF